MVTEIDANHYTITTTDDTAAAIKRVLRRRVLIRVTRERGRSNRWQTPTDRCTLPGTYGVERVTVA